MAKAGGMKVDTTKDEGEETAKMALSYTIMNKSQRAHHVNPSEVLEGGELSEDGKYHIIGAGQTVVVTEKIGKILLKNYPADFVNMTLRGK